MLDKHRPFPAPCDDTNTKGTAMNASDTDCSQSSELEWSDQVQLLEHTVDSICINRPTGFDWELHRDWFADRISLDNAQQVADECIQQWRALWKWTDHGWRKNRAAIVQQLIDSWQRNSHLAPDQQLNVHIAAEAILNNQIEPDTNDGAITDRIEALAFGALMQAGAWWATVEIGTAQVIL